MAELAWEQGEITLFGKKVLEPRLTAWYGDAGKNYTYSGKKQEPLAWHPHLLTIKKDVEKEPLISPALSLSVLFDEYQLSENFLKKAKSLQSVFGKSLIRKARKDGNCFYRSFLFRFCEILCMGSQFFEKFKVFEKVKGFTDMMLKAGFEKMVFEDFESFFLEFLGEIKNGRINILNAHTALSDKGTFDFYVMYLRFLISAYIRTSGPLFEMYFESDYELKQFCSREVEPIDAEADQIQIIALFNLFEVPLRIFYLDNNNAESPTVLSLPDLENNNTEEVKKSQAKYLIQLLYRPGHYDILY